MKCLLRATQAFASTVAGAGCYNLENIFAEGKAVTFLLFLQCMLQNLSPLLALFSQPCRAEVSTILNLVKSGFLQLWLNRLVL